MLTLKILISFHEVIDEYPQIIRVYDRIYLRRSSSHPRDDVE